MQDDVPSHIDLKVGESRVVALQQFGVGGYSWTADVVEGEVEVEQLPPVVAAPATIGASANAQFRITAKGGGNSVVRFTYGRAWEDAPERTLDIRVTAAG